MNNKKRLLYFISAFLILVVLPGCTKTPKFTELTGIWKFDPSYKIRPGKILIVGKMLNESNRIPFEDYMVSEMKIKNIKAFASYKALPPGAKVVKEQVQTAAYVMGAQSILITSVVSADQKKASANKQDGSMKNDKGKMGYFLAEPDAKKVVKVRIESGLFDVGSEKLVWAADSIILNPESVDAVIKDYTLAILNQLRLDGIIP